MRRSLLLTAGLTAALTVCAADSSARRLPAAGGEVVLALPDALQGPTGDALQSVAIAEPVDRALSPTVRAAWPPVPGTAVRSRVLASIATDDFVRWTLTPREPSPALTGSIRACFTGGEAPLPWPGRALTAAGLTPRIEDAGGATVVTFSVPVQPLPELLTGCLLRDKGSATGAFERADGGRFVARSAGPGGRPLIDAVIVRGADSPADLSPGDPQTEGGSLLVAPWPDVLLLVLDDPARAADPLALGPGGDGLPRFQEALAPELLLAVRHGGRGAGARGLLPPGVGPERPLPGAREPGPPEVLELRPLADDAPRLIVRVPTGDPLAVDVADRLALLLRTKGWRAERGGEGGPGADILRWRPPVADPALALLVLAARVQTLDVRPDEAAQLLGGDRSERTAAALTLERRWIAERRAIPLLTASRWLVVHPRLRGVRLRGDGVPLLDDAAWSTP